MAALSNYLEEKLLDHVFRQISYTGPSAIYVGLFTDDPGDDNSGNELYGDGYERTQVKFEPGATVGTIANSADVVFPPATANWPTVTHVALFDNKITGNQLVHAQLTNPVDIAANDSLLISAGSLTIVLD